MTVEKENDRERGLFCTTYTCTHNAIVDITFDRMNLPFRQAFLQPREVLGEIFEFLDHIQYTSTSL